MLFGHIINDPIGNIYKDISFESTKDYNTFKNLMKEYFIKGSKMRNCEFKIDNNNVIVCIQTTKDIKAGEELLVYYEPLYWFNYNYGTNNNNEHHGLILFNKVSVDPEFTNFIINLDNFFH